MYCIDPDLVDTAAPFCAGYQTGKQTAAHGFVSPATYVAGDVIGSKIIMYHPSHQIWHCWDTTTHSACSGAVSGSIGTSDGSKFIRHSTGLTPEAVCFTREAISATTDDFMTHECMTTTGVVEWNPVPGLYMRAPNTWNWSNGYQYSEGFTSGNKMFMSFWPSERINCYDWTTQSTCTPIDGVAFDGGDMDFYTFAPLNDDCLVAVGDVSKFYTFNPETGLVCTGSTVTTTITPCSCGDGLTKRYGMLELPPEIHDVLNSATAVVQTTGGAELLAIPDLLAGPVDLSVIDGDLHGSVQLIITVDSKVDANDIPLWKEPFSASLSLTVQPTLAN